MPIERRERLHDVQIMAHGPKLGGQFVVELVDWNTDTDAPVPGSGVLLPPRALALDPRDDGTPWKSVRSLLDVELTAGATAARAEVERLTQQRDDANRERDAAMARAMKAEARAEAMRRQLEGKLEDMVAALTADEKARALAAEVAAGGT